MPYRVLCAACDYDPLVLKFEISADVIAEDHTLKTGHPCVIRELGPASRN